MKLTEQQIKQVCDLKSKGITHRTISKIVFGVATKASTVFSILKRHHYNGSAVKKEIKAPKVLLLDIETAPAVSYHWGRWKVNVGPSQVIHRPYMITWAAKWLGHDFVYSDMLPLYEGFEENPKDDYAIVHSMWKMLDAADVVIGHYVKRFDLAFLNARFAFHGLPAPSPYKVICTKEMASKNYKFEANSLKELADYFGLDNKDDMDFTDWKNCVDGIGTNAGWLKMLRYNEQDVRVLEAVYLKLRVHATNHPNFALYYNDGVMRCTTCGSKELDKLDKSAYTYLSEFESYRCECGHIMRGRKNIRSKEDMKVTLINVAQ